MKTDYKKIAVDGVIKNNPTLKLVLGTCPTLALTTMAMNGIGMGLAVTFVLICSNMIISMLRNVIPNKVRIPAFVLIIATFVTIVRLVLDKLAPDLYESMGLYLPLIVVNCIILARAESFASKNGVLASMADGLFTGIGFTLALTLMGAFREILGNGTIFGFRLWNFSIGFFASSAGAFFTFAMFIAVFSLISTAVTDRKKVKLNKEIFGIDDSKNNDGSAPVVNSANVKPIVKSTEVKPVAKPVVKSTEVKPEVKTEVKSTADKKPDDNKNLKVEG